MRGDRVKLTEQGARIQSHGYRRFARGYLDGERMKKWRERRGTVVSTPLPAGACVSVRWDDRATSDAYPKGMIELTENSL